MAVASAMLEILVVEDDPALREWLRRAFERLGHRVTSADVPRDGSHWRPRVAST